MGYESDEQIAHRKQREQAVATAWRQFRAESSRSVRRKLAHLPPANAQPKAIVITGNRKVDRRQTDWKSWGTPGRR
jgi:hypothetical protein